MKLTVYCAGARRSPRWLWRLTNGRPFVWYGTPRKTRVGFKWYEETTIELPDGIDLAIVSYLAASWGAANKFTFQPQDGQRVSYVARWWPWLEPSASVESAT